MVTKKDKLFHKVEQPHSEHVVMLIFRGFIPIVMLIGGLVLLGMRLPGWGLFIGLPLVIIGSVFLIYTYDEISKSSLHTPKEEIGLDEDAGKNI